MIDSHCGYDVCIDCNRKLTNQIHGAHFHPVKGNENIRFNLLNIHSARSECNKYDPQHHTRYKQGLEIRYGIDFLNFMEDEIRLKYKSMRFSNKEIFEAIPVVRKLQKTLPTLVNTDSLSIRRLFNHTIGLYR